jgi:GTP-binding protein EngB required for normal cell division
MKEWLEARGKPFIIVATKADKLSSNQLRANLSRTSAVLDTKAIVAYSAVTRSGADRLWKEITSRVAHRGAQVAD